MIHANRSLSTDLYGFKNDFCLVMHFDYTNIQAIEIFVKHFIILSSAICFWLFSRFKGDTAQLTFTCSKSRIETLEKRAKNVHTLKTSERRQLGDQCT